VAKLPKQYFCEKKIGYPAVSGPLSQRKNQCIGIRCLDRKLTLDFFWRDRQFKIGKKSRPRLNVTKRGEGELRECGNCGKQRMVFAGMWYSVTYEFDSFKATVCIRLNGISNNLTMRQLLLEEIPQFPQFPHSRNSPTKRDDPER
jgi:hypothetical protein